MGGWIGGWVVVEWWLSEWVGGLVVGWYLSGGWVVVEW